QESLARVPAGKALVLLDTCQSGAFAKLKTRGLEEKAALSRLVKSTGTATLMASADTQVALEGYRGHGLFTWTLLEALQGDGFGGDDRLTVNELAGYVEERLPEVSYEEFGYEQVPQRSLRGMSFPIGVR
ncbi:caspase family protein, partial [Thiohalorhabdus sp. Cl-TMA]